MRYGRVREEQEPCERPRPGRASAGAAARRVVRRRAPARAASRRASGSRRGSRRSTRRCRRGARRSCAIGERSQQRRARARRRDDGGSARPPWNRVARSRVPTERVRTVGRWTALAARLGRRADASATSSRSRRTSGCSLRVPALEELGEACAAARRRAGRGVAAAAVSSTGRRRRPRPALVREHRQRRVRDVRARHRGRLPGLLARRASRARRAAQRSHASGGSRSTPASRRDPLVDAPVLVAPREHRQLPLELPERVAVARRGNGLPHALGLRGLPERDLPQQPREPERDER